MVNMWVMYQTWAQSANSVMYKTCCFVKHKTSLRWICNPPRSAGFAILRFIYSLEFNYKDEESILEVFKIPQRLITYN
jgi:hypothetical protein